MTFLFTDVEGSTRLWERQGDAMAVAMERHDAIVRAAIEVQGGYVFATAGDSFAAAFGRAAAALTAARAAQARLEEEAWPEWTRIRVRMGLHTGEAHERAGDYFGPSVNRAARIMSAGHGGQILVSDLTRQLVGDDGLSPLGEHRLKDLDEPVSLWQVGSIRFPPQRSREAVAHNLPGELSRLFGRDAELGQLAGLLSDGRLVTILGAGGVGKTRLALTFGAECVDQFSDGIWLVDLAPLSDPGLISTVIADALRLPVEGTRGHRQTVLDGVAVRQALVIVDNCEHLIDAVADIVGAMLAAGPELRVVATSREPLHVDGDRVLPLTPLPVTTDDGDDGPAMQLFADRAAMAGRPLTVDERTRSEVKAICSRLDGLPLAVELAASRVRSLSLGEINERLDRRFRLLTGGSRGALARQRTLEATVAWSYEMLHPPQRALFDRVSVFAGGFELDAAIQVVPAEEEFEVLDGLDQLVDRSLLVASQPVDGVTRYTMLETIRQYGRDRLVDHGLVEEVRRRHLDWLVRLTAEASPLLQLADPGAMARMDREQANVRVGLEWAAHDADLAAKGLSIAVALGRYWYQRGITAEGANWIERLRAANPRLSPEADCHTLCDLGFYLVQAGRAADALGPLDRSLDLARRLGDPAQLTRVLHYSSRAAMGLRDPAVVRALIEEGREFALRHDDRLHGYLHSVLLTVWHVLYGVAPRRPAHRLGVRPRLRRYPLTTHRRPRRGDRRLAGPARR